MFSSLIIRSQSPEKKLKQDIQQECVNTIRVLGADIVGKSNSGHPGVCFLFLKKKKKERK